MIKTEDIISTLQHLNLLAYQKGAYVICAAEELIEKHLKAAGSPGVEVDPAKLIWTPYNAPQDGGALQGVIFCIRTPATLRVFLQSRFQ